MAQRPVFLLYWILISVSVMNCSHGSIASSASVQDDITLTMNTLNRSTLSIRNLSRKRVGKSGYYYIVDSRGTIVSHPQTAMTGFRLGDNPFIRYIVRHREGCVIQDIEGKSRIILFRTLKDSSILCLTIPANELSGDIMQSCREFN